MRYACISDIHGNITAFDECLKDLSSKQIDGFIFCGDYITDIPNSNEVLEQIKELENTYPCYIVRGNREKYILDYVYQKLDWKIGSNEEPLMGTSASLSPDNFEYISKIPDVLGFTIGNHSVVVAHKLEQLSDDIKADIIITGHTHKQQLKQKDGVIFINPGSLGLGCYEGPGIYYSIIDFNEDVLVQNIHTLYHIEPVVSSIQNSYLYHIRSHWDDILILTLKYGKPYSTDYIDIMMNLTQKYNLDTSLDNLAKEVWDEGYEILLQKYV